MDSYTSFQEMAAGTGALQQGGSMSVFNYNANDELVEGWFDASEDWDEDGIQYEDDEESFGFDKKMDDFMNDDEVTASDAIGFAVRLWDTDPDDALQYLLERYPNDKRFFEYQ